MLTINICNVLFISLLSIFIPNNTPHLKRGFVGIIQVRIFHKYIRQYKHYYLKSEHANKNGFVFIMFA